MPKEAATDLATQRGQEYVFGSEADASTSATTIHYKLDASFFYFQMSK